MRILIEEYPGSVDAARFLIAARDAGVPGPRLPADCRPQTQGQAFAVQRSTARLLRETRRDDIAAWKSALPTPEKSVVAPIYTSTVHFSAASPVPSHGAVVRVEPDRLRTGARPARARTAYSEAEIDAAVGGARLALEVLGCRYALPEHASLPELLADHMFNQGLVLGPRIASADDAPASMTITLSVDGQDAEQHAGIHPNGAGPRPVCTGWRTSCVNKAPACAPASMSSLARMPASWTCRRAAISRSPTATWACCACASKRAAERRGRRPPILWRRSARMPRAASPGAYAPPPPC